MEHLDQAVGRRHAHVEFIREGGNIAGRTETLSLAIYNHVLDGNLACANTLSLVLAVAALLAFVLLRRLGAL